MQKNIQYQIREFLNELPKHPVFRGYFQADLGLSAKWKSGLNELSQRLGHVLSKPAVDSATVIHHLCLTVDNYLHELAPDQVEVAISELLDRPNKESGGDSIRSTVERRIREIVHAMDKGKHGKDETIPNFNILLGAAELERVNPSLLNKIKITVSHADRRWVVLDQDGKKVHILGT